MKVPRPVHGILLAALLALGAAACGPTPTTPSTPVAFSQTDLRLGTGAAAAAGKILTASYTGWLYDSTKPENKGLLFDTSVGGAPLSFTLGAGQVITGLERGMDGMKVGGARRIVIPPELGYGVARNGPIPPFASMVFEVDLLDAR